MKIRTEINRKVTLGKLLKISRCNNGKKFAKHK